MFVLRVDTFKARAMFASRSRAVKKPYGASLGRVQLLVARCTLTISFITSFVSFRKTN